MNPRVKHKSSSIVICLLLALLLAGVAGWDEAGKRDYPWVARIVSGGQQVCAGTLVDASYVLTLATCVIGRYELVVSRTGNSRN